MNKILRSIIEQTGVKVDSLYPYETNVDEYLLTYDKSKRLCISFGKQKDDAYYSSASWSCDALGYIARTSISLMSSRALSL